VFTRTDYAVLPPKIREGQIATVFSKDTRASTIQALLSDGQLVSISTRKLPCFRSGFALSIREARQIREPARLRIELGNARRAWAALVLAACQRYTASVVIDPAVARHADSLAIVLSGSLPGALPTELCPTRDSNAEFSAEFAKVKIENFLAPATTLVPKRVGTAAPILLADNVRDLLASDGHAARAFDFLSELLHPDKACDDIIAAKLEAVCTPNSLTMHVVNELRRAHRAKRNASQEESDLDMPRELAIQNPRQWTTSDLTLLKLDLLFMFFQGSEIDITSIDAIQNFPRPGTHRDS
jgi:hypothetical protein